MSQSSDAVMRGLFHSSMRHAAPILFWGAIALFVLTLIANYAAYMAPTTGDSVDSAFQSYMVLNAVVQGLNNAVWPFSGAAVLWAVQNRGTEEAE